MTSEAPEMRTQCLWWYVETRVCDGNGIGQWVETTESHKFSTEAEALALQDKWLSSGKLQRMSWGGLRPKGSYGLFRIRSSWELSDTTHALAMVAAERGAIADNVAKAGGCVWWNEIDQNVCFDMTPFAESIRARTPDDAKAALDALLKAERKAGRVEALREAKSELRSRLTGAVTIPKNLILAAFDALIEKETGHE